MVGHSVSRLRNMVVVSRDRTSSWRRRLGLSLAVAVVLGYLPYQLIDGPSARRIAELRGQLERTRAAVAALRHENAAHRQRIQALRRDARAIEEIARSELGMVRPGDIVVRLRGTVTESASRLRESGARPEQ
jgi:cell division protein FtsB